MDTGTHGTGTGTTPTQQLIALSKVGKISTNDFSINLPGALIEAMLQDQSTRVLQRPQLRATDGGKASLKIGSKIPYVSGSLNSAIATPGAIPYATTQFQQVEVGVIIDIQPHVNGPEDVSLHLKVEISNVTGNENIGGIDQPIIGQRVNEADVRLRNGEVSILGGLTQSDDSRTNAGIPGLVNMPVLGYFFGTKTRSSDQSDILIALVPHIIRATGCDSDRRGANTVGQREQRPRSTCRCLPHQHRRPKQACPRRQAHSPASPSRQPVRVFPITPAEAAPAPQATAAPSARNKRAFATEYRARQSSVSGDRFAIYGDVEIQVLWIAQRHLAGVRVRAPSQRSFDVAGIRRRNGFCQSGLTLVELIVAFTILLILSTMAVPIARFQIRREREKDLRQALHEMRSAIDRYKDMADQGRIRIENDTYGYPKTLQDSGGRRAVAEHTCRARARAGKIRFLRRIPKDPMTGGTEWGMRSMQDESGLQLMGRPGRIRCVHENPRTKAAMARRIRSGKRLSRRQFGFTLIELMIVMAIVSILVAIAVPIYQKAIIRAKESVLSNNLFTLRTMIDEYTVDKQHAPQTLDDLVSEGYLASDSRRSRSPAPTRPGRSSWKIHRREAITSHPASSMCAAEPRATSLDGSPYSEW